MNHLHYMLLLILIILLFPLSVKGSPDYEPPIGIPSPSFGIEEPTYDSSVHCPNWPSGVNSIANGDSYDCYYIDNSAACSDSGNIYGYPNNPRCTLPEGSLTAGTYMDIRGGVTTPYIASGDRFDWTGIGTSEDYILISGKNAAQLPIIAEFVHIGTGNSASYIILENLKIKPSNYGISIRPTTDGHDIDHISLRNLEIQGTGFFDVCSTLSIGVYSPSSFPNSETSHVVAYNITSYDSGQWDAATENDCSSFYMQGNAHYFWVLNSKSYNTGGDSVAGGHAADRTSSHYYIGGNTLFQNRENGIDIKEINNLVISENVIYGHRPTDSSGGASVVIHYGSHSVGPNEAWVLFNTIYDSEIGIIFTKADSAYIIGNLIYEINHTNPDWDPSSAYSYGAGIHIRGVPKAYVTGNTIYGYDTGIQVPIGSLDYHIENNILSGRQESAGYEIYIQNGASSVSWDNNLFHHSPGNAQFGYDSSTPRDLNYIQGGGVCLQCIEDDPLFADTGTRDYELIEGSPAIDSGMESSAYQTFFDTYGVDIRKDKNRVTRPQGSGWDIGSYEYYPVTEFYVDPDFTGSTRDGSASNPWDRIHNSQWSVIDSALANSDVIVYFSAREADTDSNQISPYAVNIYRGDTSTHRVTLDGMTKYNADDSNPVWLDSPGSYKHEIRYGYPINTGAENRSYVTVRGFKPIGGYGAYGGQALYYWGGDNVIIEYNDISHSPDVTDGALFQYGYAHYSDGSRNGGCSNIIIRHNLIHDSMGECLYIGGSGNTGLTAHTNVLVENNTIWNCGIYSPEGDCIDIKDEIINITVRDNYCYNMTGGNARGISSSSPIRAEGNVVHDANYGLSIGTYWGREILRSEVIGNIFFNNYGGGLYVSDDTDNPVKNILIEGNTIYGNSGNGITLGESADLLDNITIKNNIITENNIGIGGWGTIPEYQVEYNDVWGNIVRNYGGPVPNLSGQYGNIEYDPLFSDTDNPKGPDSTWFTSDDGFSPQTDSPVCGAGEGGTDMGALNCLGDPVPICFDLGGIDCCTGSETCSGVNLGISSDCSGICCSEICESAGQYFLPEEYVEAEDGEMTSPMQIGNNITASGGVYVYTTTDNLGSVTFTYNIQQAGRYRMEALILSPAPNTGGSNSFYIGLDNEAVQGNEEYTYDTIESEHFVWDDVSLRGLGGTFEYADYDPKVWDLSVGLHNFTFLGREANTWLDQIILTRAYHRSDTNQNGCVETGEMIAFMDRWKISVADVPMHELMQSIGLWKSGSGCS